MIDFDSSDMDRWADLPDAHHRFPELIRRLVFATGSNPSQLDFPSGSSVRLAGWDGLVEVDEGNAWVPNGASAWELSCENSRSLTGKATSDYEKRTEEPLGVDIALTTFVFATPRKWPGKRRWIRERRKDGRWLNVRAFDADDLVAWMEQAPEVSIWFARLSGKLPASYEEILPFLNNQESLHVETRNEQHRSIEAAVAEIKADFRQVLAQPSMHTEPGTSGTTSESAHSELEVRINFARDLIDRGLVNSARVELGRIRGQAEAIPDALRFRIITNLAACSLAEEDFSDASALLEEAYELQPNDRKAIANAALVAQFNQDWERAAEMATMARESDVTDSQATAVLLETYWRTGDVERLEDLISAEGWISGDMQCSLVLANIRVSQSRSGEAVTLCRSLAATNPEDASVHVALSQLLLQNAQEDRHVAGYTDNWESQLKEAENEATLAVDTLRSTELALELQRALVIRGCARALLGESSQAMRDFDEVLAEVPDHGDAAFNKGLFLFHDGRAAEARASFERIRGSERWTDVVVPLADACLESGDPLAAVNLLKGTLTLDSPTWADVRRAEIMHQAESLIGEEDTVTPILESASERFPNDPKLLTLFSMCRKASVGPEDVEKSLCLALECADEPDRPEVLARLGSFYQSIGRFSEAADRLAEIANGIASQPTAVPLLISLANSKRYREALDWVRKIRGTRRQPPKIAIEVEAQILQQVGDGRGAALRYQELCSREDATSVDHVRLAIAQFRCGERDAATETVRDIRASDLRHDPMSILKLAQLKLLLGLDGYVEDAYLGRRCGFDEPELHLGYFGLFLSRENEWIEPEVVGPGCAVLLTSEGAERWWLILDNSEESRSPYELSPSQDLAQKLMGRQVGDTVVLREGFEDLAYEVAAVQSKFVRAFQETSDEFSTRFPGNTSMYRLKVEEDDLSKIFQTVDRRAQFVQEAERLYREGVLPLAAFSSLVGISTIEAWNAVTKNPSMRFRSGTGTDEETEASGDLLNQASGLLVDLTALLAVHELGIAEHLRGRFSRIFVPQQVIDEIQQCAFVAKMSGQAPAYLGKEANGKYTWAEMPDSYLTQRREYLKSILSLAETFEIVAAYGLLDSDDFETLLELLTPAAVGAVYASDGEPKDGLVLVTDDLGLSNFARSLGKTAVNTQGVIWELYRSSVITGETYSSLIEQLLLLNYWFVRVSADDILRRLEANGFMTTPGIHAMLKTLEGPDCSEDSAVLVGTTLVTELAKIAPSRQVDLVLSAVVAVLRRGRELTDVLLKFRREVAQRLALAPFARNDVLQTLDVYIRL